MLSFLYENAKLFGLELGEAVWEGGKGCMRPYGSKIRFFLPEIKLSLAPSEWPLGNSNGALPSHSELSSAHVPHQFELAT